MRAVLAILAAALPGLAVAQSLPPPAAAFTGRYVVIGQGPEWGPAYAGTGSIADIDETTLTMTRRIGGAEIVETGRIEVPTVPPEGWMLKLYDGDGALVAGCLWGVDLDNYTRLTCYRGPPGAQPDMPGLEAWFPLEPVE